jgi:uncharacterized protein (PEP-CTERM system associated)
LLLSSNAHAAQWTFAPAVEASETYTDNVKLQPQASAKSDFVTEVTPSISIIGAGPNLKLKSYFALQDINYANQNASSTLLKQLNVDANVRLIDNLLYFDGASAISQQNISAFGPQPVNNTNGSANQTSVRTTHISPYLSRNFDNFAKSELRYAHDSVASDSGQLSSTQTDTISFKTDSGSAFRIMSWGVQYNDQIIHYPASDNVELQSVSGNLGYLIMPRFKLTASAGYDHNDYAALGGTSKGYSWTTGFDWTVSRRTSLSATVGRHYYGNSASLSAATRSRFANWLLSYNEAVTTTPSQFTLPGSVDTASYLEQLLSGTITDPVARAQAVNNLIQSGALPATLANSVNYFTNTTFLQKQLQASVLLNSPKSTLLLSLFNTQREPLSTQQTASVLPGSNDKTNQSGVSAVFSRRLSARTSANVTLLAQRAESLTTDRVDRNQSVRLGLTRELGRKLRGTVEVRRNQAQSSLAGADYRENAISAFLNFQL